MQFMVSELDTVFIRKSEAAKLLGLSAYQLNVLISKLKLEQPRIAGVHHLYTYDVDNLIGSVEIAEAQASTDPNKLRHEMRKSVLGW